jgi:peroxiredoxin
LLSDVDRSVGKQYEVARPADDQYADYPMRIAYLIDPSGAIKHAYDVKDVSAHAADVIADLESLTGG